MATSGFTLQLSKRAASDPSLNNFVVYPDGLVTIDRNRLDLRLANGRVSRAARWNHQIHTIFEQRRSDHKNNQQHKARSSGG